MTDHNNQHQSEDGEPIQIRCQVFPAMTDRQALELELTLLVELARRKERPDLDIDTYFEQVILPECDTPPLTDGAE